MKRVVCGVVFVMAVLGLTGCSTTSMKGTPFARGEYTSNLGDAQDRVNLWPLLYYRDPALSVLWPIFEYSDDHYAVRPLLSYYGRGTNHRELNLLWPLGKFRPDRKENYFFPFFWGEDYLVGFPLYYQFDEPLQGRGSTTLFPLWSYSARSQGKSLHLLWPIAHWSNREQRAGWRVWPLAGSYNNHGDRYRFAAWPLGHCWENRDGVTRGHTLLPLYYRGQDASSERFYSLPYSRGSSANGDHWRVVVPLWYSQTQGDVSEWGSLLGGWRKTSTETNTVVLPALSWSSKTKLGRDTKLLLGLGRIDHAGETQGSHLFPLYRHQRWDDASSFLSLPYSHCTKANGDHWRVVPPLWYDYTKGDTRAWGSLLGGRRASSSATNSLVLPALSWSSRTAAGSDTKLLLGLGRIDRAGETQGSHILPLYKHEHSDDTSSFLSLPYSQSSSANGDHWRVVLPLWYDYTKGDTREWGTLLGGRRTSNTETNVLVLPALSWSSKTAAGTDTRLLLGLGRIDRAGEAQGSHLIPLYKHEQSEKESLFLSLPYSRKHEDGGTSWCLIPPLWYSRQEAAGGSLRLTLLYGDRKRVDGSYAWRALVPFVSSRQDPEDQLVASLLGGWRTRGERTAWLAWPLLAGGRSEPENNRLWYLAGLGHASWGKRSNGRQWLVPFYYRDARAQSLVSPLYCRWMEAGTTGKMIPPALTWWERSGDELRVRTALGLAGWDRFRGKTESSYLFPLYSYRKDDHFLTLLAGRKQGDDGFSYMATPLIGTWHGDTSGEWVFPLWDRRYVARNDVHSIRLLWGYYKRTGEASVRSGLFPLYGYRHSKHPPTHKLGGGSSRSSSTHFWSLPICWYNNSQSTREAPEALAGTRERKSAGIFPLYYYKRKCEQLATGERARVRWNLLWRLFDYRAEHDAPPPAHVAAAPAATAATAPVTEPHDYTRSRVLWRVYHRETLDGAATTDIFPGIVFDRTADGRRSWSLLWRLLAYEREEDGGRRMHLLFIPIRTHGAD